MTGSILSLILKSALYSALYSAVFFGYYLVALKRAQVNGFSRFYLLAAALASVVLPFVQLRIPVAVPVAVPDFPLLQSSGPATGEAFPDHAASIPFRLQAFFPLLYAAVSGFLLLRLTVPPFLIHRLKRRGKPERRQGYTLIRTEDPRAPFSFMRLLFWPAGLQPDSPEGRIVLRHELAHIRQRHTLDKLFVGLLLAIGWMNPFLWLIRRELWLQHEFLADRSAIRDRDGATFARMLLACVMPGGSAPINRFFHSPVKRRLMMITQAESRHKALRFLGTGLTLMAAVLLLSFQSKDGAPVAASGKKIVVVLDPGHGGEDIGAVGPGGDREKDLNLALCEQIRALAPAYNVEVVLTRDGDVTTSLYKRVEISNASAAALFLAIHVNKGEAGQPHTDYELIVNDNSAKQAKSRMLASALVRQLREQRLPVRMTDRHLHVLRENRLPAALLECGSLDDAENMAALKDEARSEQLCRRILSGIVDFSNRMSKG